MSATLTHPLAPPVRGPVLAGLLAIALAATAGGAWGALAPLDSAALAPGRVVVETHRKPVAHMEGGIVSAVLARDGDRVRAGQVLLRLDGTRADAARDALVVQRDALLALDARLTAEGEGLPDLRIAPDLQARAADPRVAGEIAGQRSILESRRAALAGEVELLNRQATRAEAEIASHRAQIRSLDAQRALIGEELDGVRALHARGLERKPRLLALERQAVALDAARSELEGRIAQAGQAVAEAQLRIVQRREQRLSEIASERRDARTRLAGIDERLRAAADVARRHELTAPVDGVVMGLTATPGAVVKAGEPVLHVIPVADRLVVAARVMVTDVDDVRVGQAAEMRFSAFSARRVPPVTGKVLSLSADAVVDPQTGASHYEATVVPDDGTALPDGALLQPGMPAEVVIATGRRTLWDYLSQPVADSFRRAMRER